MAAPKRRPRHVQEDGFGGMVKGAALTRYTAAWREFNRTGDISVMWRMGVWERPDDWPDDEDEAEV